MKKISDKNTDKNVSRYVGTAGYVLSQHVAELNSLASTANSFQIMEFVNNILPEMNKSAQDYMRVEILNKIGHQPYMKIYKHLYNIYLAGLSGCKIGVTGATGTKY